VLKTIQWAAPLALIVTLIFAPTGAFSGMGVVWTVSFSLMIANLVIWACYILGLQRTGTQSGNTIRFISFSPVDFFIAAAGTALFGICSLICAIVFLYTIAHEYNASVPISYLFATIFSLISGAAHGYYAILMYRACPNGITMHNLSLLQVEGTKIDHNVGIRPTQGV